jgi:hypothetical protein
MTPEEEVINATRAIIDASNSENIEDSGPKPLTSYKVLKTYIFSTSSR